MPPSAGFPLDDYTPNGYLANPAHTWRANPSGVIRSVAPIGFGWYFPAFPGPYSRKWLYAAALRVGIAVDGRRLLMPQDFAREQVRISAPYHSSQLFRFEWQIDGIIASATFTRTHDHVIGCTLRLLNTGTDRLIQVLGRIDYARNVEQSPLWEHGLYRRTEEDAPVIGVYPEGTAVALGALYPPGEVADVLFDLPGLPPLDGTSTPRVPRVAFEAVWNLELAAGTAVAFPIALARQESSESAVLLATAAARDVRYGERDALEVDTKFWSEAPQLVGDWPDHWRRGAVYDLETLRLCVRPPVGIFRGPWDGMQQQAPRLVLAEAALDAVLIGYADPRLAQSILLTAFRDSPDVNVPCCREDGSYNMVAADGQGCGTAPEWCFPLWCVELAWRRTRDTSFLQAIYPYAVDYVNWWLRNRTDEHGGLYYLCSWESGQDGNPRFGEQATGGDLTIHVRPSDLHAAIVQAATLLANWSARLDRPNAERRWHRIARRYRALTQEMWTGDWFDDLDARLDNAANTTSPPVRDVMQLAAVFCGVATPKQQRVLAARLDDLPKHGGRWSPLEWAPTALTAIESAWLIGRRDLVARLSTDLVEHVYRVTDERAPHGSNPLPGISCEHWNRSGGSWGAEGYGWGALPLMAVLRWILGVREEPQGLTLSPCLPDDWLVPGRHYEATSLPIGLPPAEALVEPLGATARIHVSYTVQEDRTLLATITIPAAQGRSFTIRSEETGRALARGRRRLRFTMENLSAVRIEIG